MKICLIISINGNGMSEMAMLLEQWKVREIKD